MDYTHYQAKDFILEHSFQQWVKNPDPQTTAFWESWLADHPEKQPAVDEAKKFLLSLQFETSFRNEQTLLKFRQQLEKDIERPLQQPSPDTETVQVRVAEWWKQPVWLRAAAMLLMALLFTLLYTTLSQTWNTVRYTTDYGQVREIMLPDSSMVTLNGNSAITFEENWDRDEIREIWLEGEAYFQVREMQGEPALQVSISDAQIAFADELAQSLTKFVVHSGAVDVEVLGTVFNVNNRHQQTKVFLESGKVKVSVPQSQKAQEILMEPGDLVEYAQAESSLTKKVTEASRHTSWKDNQLFFDKVPLKEIALILEDTYGMEVVFEDNSLMERQFKGALPSNDVNMLITALSRIYPLSREGKRIIFKAEE